MLTMLEEFLIIFSSLLCPSMGSVPMSLRGPICRGGGSTVMVLLPQLCLCYMLCNFGQVTSPLCEWYFNTSQMCIYHMLSMVLDVSCIRSPSLPYPAGRGFILTFQMRKQKSTND